MTGRSSQPARASAAIARPLSDFAAAAVRNDGVDPITTELVRLRCASHHACST